MHLSCNLVTLHAPFQLSVSTQKPVVARDAQSGRGACQGMPPCLRLRAFLCLTLQRLLLLSKTQELLERRLLGKAECYKGGRTS